MAVGRLMVPLCTQMLEALLGQLHKAAASDEADAELVALGERRLADDMYPLFDQVRFASLQAIEAVARLQGHPVPEAARPTRLEEAERVIGDALLTLAKACESDLDAGADRPLRLELDGGLCFVLQGDEYVRDWALPQFHFHLVTAYAIMRAAGVPLGKADYVGHMSRYAERPASAG